MSKAWMPFFVSDYLGDTGHLNHEEHGVYLLAIMHYWQTGKPLPANAKQLLLICRCFDAAKFDQIWETVSKFFTRSGGTWTHKRIDEELEKAKKLSETRRLNGGKGGASTASKRGSNC